MSKSDLLLPEYDLETASTRRALERVPDGKFDWKPHAKSGSLGWLATHVATLTNFAARAIDHVEFDIAPNGEAPKGVVPATSQAELLATFEKSTTEARAAIARCTDKMFDENWTLKFNGNALFTMPRYMVIRQFMMNHIIHHRGELIVYLRLLDIPVPGLYGPSADEKM